MLNALDKMPELECTIYFTGESTGVESFLEAERLTSIRHKFFESDLKCIKAIRKANFNTIWFFNINHIGLALIFLPRKYRIVMTVANMYLSRFKFVHWRQKTAFEYLCKRVDMIDCLYPAALSEFKKRHYENVRITPCPFINLSDFMPKNKSKNIVFASRLIPAKNVEKAVAAVKKVEADIKKSGYHVFIYGDGVLKVKIAEQLKLCNMEEYVTLCGYADLREVLPYSKIFLSLSDVTNYPSQVLLESISSGNYIVTIKDEDTNKIVDEKFCCFVDNSIEGISEGIRKAIMVTSSERAEFIVKDARNFAEKNFVDNDTISYFKEILFDLKQEGKGD